MATKVTAVLSHPQTESTAERLYFEECKGGRSMVMVWSKHHNYGKYYTDHYGDKLGRDWVRKFAREYGLTPTF